MDLVHHGQLARLRLLPLALPAPQLPLDISLLAPELTQPDLVGINPMDCDQCVDHPLADRSALVLREGRCVVRRSQDRALDEAHHVEGRAVDVLVLAEPDDGRHGDGSLLQGGDHAVLAAHVVGGAEPLAERGTAERPGVAGRVPHPEGHVRAAPGDPVEAQWQLDLRHVRPEPALHAGAIDPLRCLGSLLPCRRSICGCALRISAGCSPPSGTARGLLPYRVSADAVKNSSRRRSGGARRPPQAGDR